MILPKHVQVYDLAAHYEPRSDFALSARLRHDIKDLARKYGKPAWMTGAYSGKPTIHTDMKGIAIGTRIEMSSLITKPVQRQSRVADVFRCFVEAEERGISSGPIARMTVRFDHADRRVDLRVPIKEAFEEVFDSTCCFQFQFNNYLRIGRAVVHQGLVSHLREDGPYHSDHQPRVEKVRNELHRQPGRYEGYRYFVEPLFTPGEHPEVNFCYSGARPDRLIEVTLRQKGGEELKFLPESEVNADPGRFVSLTDYDLGARRFGNLWVMQEGRLRKIDRVWLPLVYLFMDEEFQPILDRSFSWEELYDRQRSSDFAPISSRQSTTFLDICIERLRERRMILRDSGRYRLHPDFLNIEHVTYYELGEFDKRLA
jgi:hypothetical protein